MEHIQVYNPIGGQPYGTAPTPKNSDGTINTSDNSNKIVTTEWAHSTFDGSIKEAKDAATSATTKANTALQTANTASTKADNALSKAEEASTKGSLPLGHIYLWPFSTPPDGSIQVNGSTYNRSLYSDLWALIQEKGWYKSESEWQSIASANGGYCPYYSSGDGSTTFRTPKFAPYQKLALASGDAGKYYETGLPNITGSFYVQAHGGDDAKPHFFVHSSGALYSTNGTNNAYTASGGSSSLHKESLVNFDASRSSSIYGNSNTEQPESHDWIVCVVAFGTATNIGSVDVANVMSAVGQVQANPNLQGITHIVKMWKSSDGLSWYRKWSDGWIEQGGDI